MGRTPNNKTTTVINGKVRNFKPKQIILKGETLNMFNYDRNDREIGDSQLGSEIIKEHYRRNPPLGYYKTKD